MLEPTRPESSDVPGVTATNRQHHAPPLGVELTGYRLLTTSVTLGLGFPKAICSYRGQSLISTTFDGPAGIMLALTLFWLGMIDAKHPEMFPRFFQADLAPPLLKFVSRHAGYFCFLSFAFVLHATRQLRAVLDATWDGVHVYEIAANQITFKLTSAALGFGMSVWVFCSLCWRAVRRRGFEDDHDFLLSSGFLVSVVYAVYLTTIFEIVFCLSKLRDWHRLHPILAAAIPDFPWTSICFALVLCLYGPGSDVRGARETLVLVAVVLAFGVGNWYLGISREA